MDELELLADHHDMLDGPLFRGAVVPVDIDDFQSLLWQWRSVWELEKYLKARPTALGTWSEGVTIHHTWRPTAAQWRGRDSLVALRRYYAIERGWTAGPHLFIVHGAPNARHDGIWQLTPLSKRGIHAGICNDRWGIEVVGDYDGSVWPAELEKLVVGTVRLLLTRAPTLKLEDAYITGHRECLPNKSCPGSAIDMDVIRRKIVG